MGFTDIYDYIPSHDVASHCRSLHYNFSPFDMACIYSWNPSVPIAKKINLYKDLLIDYPDMKLQKDIRFYTANGKPCKKPTFHEYLKQYILFLEGTISDWTNSTDCRYYITPYSLAQLGYNLQDFGIHLGDSIQKRLLRKETILLSSLCDDYPQIPRYDNLDDLFLHLPPTANKDIELRIEKECKTPTWNCPSYTATYKNGIMMDIRSFFNPIQSRINWSHECLNLLTFAHIKMPCPFQVNDIVCTLLNPQTPMVVLDLPEDFPSGICGRMAEKYKTDLVCAYLGENEKIETCHFFSFTSLQWFNEHT